MGSNRHMTTDTRGAHTPEAARETAPGSQGPAGSRIHNSISRRASLMQEPVLVGSIQDEHRFLHQGCATGNRVVDSTTGGALGTGRSLASRFGGMSPTGIGRHVPVGSHRACLPLFYHSTTSGSGFLAVLAVLATVSLGQRSSVGLEGRVNTSSSRHLAVGREGCNLAARTCGKSATHRFPARSSRLKNAPGRAPLPLRSIALRGDRKRLRERPGNQRGAPDAQSLDSIAPTARPCSSGPSPGIEMLPISRAMAFEGSKALLANRYLARSQ